MPACLFGSACCISCFGIYACGFFTKSRPTHLIVPRNICLTNPCLNDHVIGLPHYVAHWVKPHFLHVHSSCHFWTSIAGFVCHQSAAADALLGWLPRMLATLLQSRCVLLLLHWFTKFLSSVLAGAHWPFATGVESTLNHSHAVFGLGRPWSSGLAVGKNRVYSPLGEHTRPDSIAIMSEILVDLGFRSGKGACWMMGFGM